MSKARTTFKRAGKAIGGGKLTKAYRNCKCIGTIVESLGFYIVQVPGFNFVLCNSMVDAKSKFE